MATVYVNGTVYTMRHEGDKCTAFVVDDGNLCIVGRMKEPGLLEKDARW